MFRTLPVVHFLYYTEKYKTLLTFYFGNVKRSHAPKEYRS